jgi:hypothetical protein
MHLKALNNPGKIALSVFLISIVISTISAIIMLELLLSDNEAGFVLPTMEKIKIKYSYPLIVSSMKTSMYEYVVDDEDIETVEFWIEQGKKDDAIFKDQVMPILADDCTSCHNRSSTKTKAAPNIPLTSFEAVLTYTEAGYSWGAMARQAHLHLFGIGTFLVILSLLFAYTDVFPWIKYTLIISSAFGLWTDVLCWWLTKYYVNFAYVIFFAGGVLCGSIILMSILSLIDLWVKIPFISATRKKE